jgi:glycine cleavage system H protein
MSFAPAYNSMCIEVLGGLRAVVGAIFMLEMMEFTVDKFTFTLPTDRLYHPDGLWVLERDGQLVVGVTDFFQQNNGDVAFATMVDVGTAVAAGQRLGDVETIKIDVELTAPISGTIVEINEKLELEAEVINQDPYSTGWLVVIAPTAWAVEQANLMSPQAYYEHSHARARQEIGKK